MDPDSTMAANIILLIILIFINAFFAMSEIAIVTFNDAKLKKLADEGNKKAKMLCRVVKEPSKFLATIQVGITFAGFFASATAADNFAGHITAALGFLPVSQRVLHSIALIVITIALSYITLVFGELVPKRIAMHNAEAVSLAAAPAVLFLFRVEKPFVAILSASTNAVLRLIHINPEDKPEQVTEEEIRMMVDVGNEEGNIEESEKEMINNIFEFDGKVVEEVMTHRTEITSIEETATVAQVVELAIAEGFSRIPVYREDIDDIIGIVYAKDMLKYVGKTMDENEPITNYIREVIFVPESNRCTELFKTFKTKKIQMAVVVDEYGGTAGIVTMEDLLEAIVGNMQDEYDNEEEEVSQLAENIYVLEGSMSVDEVEKVLDVSIDEEEEYDTLGGLITDLLDRIPGEDEHPSVKVQNVEFTVLLVEDRRIAKVRAEITREQREEQDEEKGA